MFQTSSPYYTGYKARVDGTNITVYNYEPALLCTNNVLFLFLSVIVNYLIVPFVKSERIRPSEHPLLVNCVKTFSRLGIAANTLLCFGVPL